MFDLEYIYQYKINRDLHAQFRFGTDQFGTHVNEA